MRVVSTRFESSDINCEDIEFFNCSFEKCTFKNFNHSRFINCAFLDCVDLSIPLDKDTYMLACTVRNSTTYTVSVTSPLECNPSRRKKDGP